MADWDLLRRELDRATGSVHFTWDELDALVGGLPPSATNHRAWWSGDRTHVNSWRRAGYMISNLVLGREVTFVRDQPEEQTAVPRPSPLEHRTSDLLLVACVKKKLSIPAAAKDLYVSTLFRKERSYAERSGVTWFILSAEHGLVAPDEWLAPYERYLPDTPATFRRAWGSWVVERLELLAGSLAGRTVEVHAGSAYVDALRQLLLYKDAAIVEPLAGLTMGQRLAWYGEPSGLANAVPAEARGTLQQSMVDDFYKRLREKDVALAPRAFVDRGSRELTCPGLYSWWVDEEGAHDLAIGLGHPMGPGLIYAGLAGATRWPSGRRSTNTLWSRIAGMHLGGRHEFSTFRRTLGAVLASARSEPTIDETALTDWMHSHLAVIAVPYDDADGLGRLEEAVLARLDPPLNLKGMTSSPVRQRVTALRKGFSTS